MPLSMSCPQCQKKFKVADHLAGKKVNCPGCQAKLPVPAAGPGEVELDLPPPAPARQQDDELKLYVPGEEPGSRPETVGSCPTCGHDITAGAVMCVHCGYNFKTKQAVRGHEIKVPGRGKWYIGTMLSSVFFFLVVCGGGYAIYWAFTKGDITKRFRDINDPNAQKTGEPAQAPENPAQPANAKAPEAVPQSLLVIQNDRFARITVFKNGVRIGQAEKGVLEKIVLPAGNPVNSPKVTFEVKNEDLPRGTTLPADVRDAMATGVPFGGTTAEGLRVIFPGPPAGALPKAGEVLQGISLATGEYEKSSGTGRFKLIVHKGHTIRGVNDKTPLRLGWKLTDSGKVELSWLDQDCVIEKDGKPVYLPTGTPFKQEAVRLVQKDGKPDVAP